MNASELISALQTLISRHGDLPVRVQVSNGTVEAEAAIFRPYAGPHAAAFIQVGRAPRPFIAKAPPPAATNEKV